LFAYLKRDVGKVQICVRKLAVYAGDCAIVMRDEGYNFKIQECTVIAINFVRARSYGATPPLLS
jgi:hypothetical protein